jgi:hypothetical protein
VKYAVTPNERISLRCSNCGRRVKQIKRSGDGKGRHISISGKTHAAVSAHCENMGIPIKHFVSNLCDVFLQENVDEKRGR